MLNTPQLPDKDYKPKKLPYPETDKWEYKGNKLHYHICKTVDEPKALLFYFHGMNSHGGSSGYFATTLANSVKDMNAYSVDFLNFGLSDSPNRGCLQSFDHVVEQAEAFVKFILGKYEKEPKIFFSGMSFGGSTSFKIAIEKRIKPDGCILLNPALRENYMSAPFMKKVGKMIGYLFPKL